MGWQHHPPRHAAARAAIGVQAAHATLGMAPPHMPPSSPRHANAKRARPRHRGEPSHARQQSPRAPHTLHPGRVPCPPCRTRPPPMQRVPSPRTRPRPSSSRSTPEPSMLPRKNVPMASDAAAHPRGLTRASRADAASIKRHTGRPSPCNECPPRALGPARLAEEPSKPSSERHVASGKACRWPTSAASPGGHTHMPPARRCPAKRHTDVPPPAMQRVLPPRADPTVRLVEEPSKPSSEHVAPEMGRTPPLRHAYVGSHEGFTRRSACGRPEVASDESRFDA